MTDRGVRIGLDVAHRPELAELDDRAIKARTILDEEHRAPVYCRDGCRDDQLDRQRDGEQRRAPHDVESALAV